MQQKTKPFYYSLIFTLLLQVDLGSLHASPVSDPQEIRLSRFERLKQIKFKGNDSERRIIEEFIQPTQRVTHNEFEVFNWLETRVNSTHPEYAFGNPACFYNRERFERINMLASLLFDPNLFRQHLQEIEYPTLSNRECLILYLGLITVMRDLDPVTSDESGEPYKLILKNHYFFSSWARSHSFEPKKKRAYKTIGKNIRDQRRSYYELLGYQFYQQHTKLTKWHGVSEEFKYQFAKTPEEISRKLNKLAPEAKTTEERAQKVFRYIKI